MDERNPMPAPTTAAQHSNAPAAVGFEASFERFRAEAAGVDSRDVKTFPYNASIVLYNVRTGVASVLAERPWFEAQPDAPAVDFARVAAAETSAEALVFAAGQAASIGRIAPSLRPKLVRARVVVRTLKSAAATLVATGELSDEELPAGGGRGPLATARACLAYAALFRAKHAKTRGATSVKAALVAEAGALGSELLRELTPRGAMKRSPRTEAERATADARDRMAVVVASRYAYVERVAGWRWGRGLDAFVPAMLSRDTARGAASDEEALDDEEAHDEEDDGADEGDAEGEDDAANESGADDGAAEDDASDEDVAEEEPEPVKAKKPGPKKATAPKSAKVAPKRAAGRR